MSAKVENAQRPCDIERAAIDWEEKAKDIQRVLREDSVGKSTWYIYCVGRATGLREALDILGQEEV